MLKDEKGMLRVPQRVAINVFEQAPGRQINSLKERARPWIACQWVCDLRNLRNTLIQDQ